MHLDRVSRQPCRIAVADIGMPAGEGSIDVEFQAGASQRFLGASVGRRAEDMCFELVMQPGKGGNAFVRGVWIGRGKPLHGGSVSGP